MSQNQNLFHIILEEGTAPVMYGIRSADGVCARRISSDYAEVAGLVERCNLGGLSPVHLHDVVEDFRRS